MVSFLTIAERGTTWQHDHCIGEPHRVENATSAFMLRGDAARRGEEGATKGPEDIHYSVAL